MPSTQEPENVVNDTQLPSFTFPASLSPFNFSLAEWIRQNPRYQVIATGALVFYNDGTEDRILLVQRASTESAFPLMWETPGGSCDAKDRTVLHGTARELWEEAGLKALKFIRLVEPEDGVPHEFQTGRPNKMKSWCKLSFEVEVEKVGDPGVSATKENEFLVTLDPVEHQDWKWVTRKEIEENKFGETMLKWTSEDQRKVILRGFDLRRGNQKSGQ